MASWLDEKYVNLLSSSLRNFKRKKQGLWNLSCPLCGDSQKDKRRARGYFYYKKGVLKYSCHNCTANHRFDIFLKMQNPYLHAEYLKEKIQERRPDVIEAPKKKEPSVSLKIFNSLKSIEDLDPEHPARVYVQERMIPGHYYKSLFYAPYFKKFTNTLVPEKFNDESLTRDEPRLIIPYVLKDGTVTGYTGRSFDPEAPVRYLAIRLDNDAEPVFGLDRVDMSKTYYVLEGPLDSMFVENSIAAGSGGIFYQTNENGVACYDNQPRNFEICKVMERTLEAGKSIVIWPESMEGKDINDLVRNGYSSKDVLDLISKNTYSGLSAKLKFASWKKT